MQFLEWSYIGLRSARYVFESQDTGKTETLFPMLHLGEPQFYDQVYEDAATHDAVLLEGVRARTATRLTRVYRLTKPARMGLVVPPKFAVHGVRAVHGDISEEEFEALWADVPRRERLLLEFGAGAYGIWLRFAGSRAGIGNRMTTNDLKGRDEILGWSEAMAPTQRALIDRRNDVLCDRLTGLLSDNDPARSIAILYGAGHMPAVSRQLRAAGFRVVDALWLTVFEA
ncbi:MAG: hypothetical protein MK180_02200 [Rhodobacteraceae bacterium]|nr:hypothetical protein [Paracoccaceae bacterium]